MFESQGVFSCGVVVDKSGEGWIVSGDEVLLKELDGVAASDNYFEGLPKDPGHYQCRVDFMYSAGGGEFPEDEWRYDVVSAVKMEETALLARVRELEERHTADETKMAEIHEHNNRLQSGCATAKDACGKVVDWLKKTMKERLDLPAGFVPELKAQVHQLRQVLSDPEGWERYYDHEYRDMDSISKDYDFRRIGELLGMTFRENEYVPSWEIVARLRRRLAEEKTVQA